ncbi:MAG: c-type cytochrome [Planctomycetales bacterium]|nr:c-type cytochrome [Planctomycetales bacterium]
MPRSFFPCLLFALCVSSAFAPAVLAEPFALHVPAGLAARNVRVPADNELTAAKVELGRQLFFDARLSRDDTVSCATCHDPKFGWSNGQRFATGVDGQMGGRNAPTILNAGYLNAGSPRFAKVPQFWDGRAEDLEGQALGPIQNPIEMDLKLDALVAKLSKIDGYKKQFQAAFGGDVSADGIAKAIASFERTILSGDAPIDRFLAGDAAALSESAQRGWQVFSGGAKGNCTACHKVPNFADGGFHNLGVGAKAESPDVGRFAVTNLEGDKGRFKTPTLRDIERTAPYMHDGSQATLEEVVKFYVDGGEKNPHLDEEMKPLKLTEQERQDLLTFLKEGLSSANYPMVEAPTLPE